MSVVIWSQKCGNMNLTLVIVFQCLYVPKNVQTLICLLKLCVSGYLVPKMCKSKFGSGICILVVIWSHKCANKNLTLLGLIQIECAPTSLGHHSSFRNFSDNHRGSVITRWKPKGFWWSKSEVQRGCVFSLWRHNPPQGGGWCTLDLKETLFICVIQIECAPSPSLDYHFTFLNFSDNRRGCVITRWTPKGSWWTKSEVQRGCVFSLRRLFNTPRFNH